MIPRGESYLRHIRTELPEPWVQRMPDFQSVKLGFFYKGKAPCHGYVRAYLIPGNRRDTDVAPIDTGRPSHIPLRPRPLSATTVAGFVDDVVAIADSPSRLSELLGQTLSPAEVYFEDNLLDVNGPWYAMIDGAELVVERHYRSARIVHPLMYAGRTIPEPVLVFTDPQTHLLGQD